MSIQTMDDDESSAEPPSPHADAGTPDLGINDDSDTTADAEGLSIDILDPLELLGDQRTHALMQDAARVLGQLDATGQVRVKIVDDAQMALAHERYSQVSGTTDVLTFDLRTQPDDLSEPLDTDLLVCYDQAARQCENYGHSVERELLLYIVHGVLHCLGYDDHTDADATAMHAREDALLIQAGFGPIYAPQRKGGGL